LTSGDWKSIEDIAAADVTLHVKDIRDSGLSAQTIQARLQSVKSFTKWLSDHHRLKLNPLSMIRKPDPKSDRRHERRMLLPEEWKWLFKSLHQAEGLLNGMEPLERLLLYRAAVQTGMRAGELLALTRARMVLDHVTPNHLQGGQYQESQNGQAIHW
jgi:integrase